MIKSLLVISALLFATPVFGQQADKCHSVKDMVTAENAIGSNTMKIDPALENIILLAFRVVTKNTMFDRFNDANGALIVFRRDDKTVFVYFTKNDIACEGIETTSEGMTNIFKWVQQHPLDNGIPA